MNLIKIKKIIKKHKTLYVILRWGYRILNLRAHYNLKRKEKRLRKNGKQVLIKAKKALNDINIKFWLDFGTLLGAYRDGDFVKSDSDIDIGVFIEDYSPDIEKQMERNGFKKIKQYEIDGGKYGLEQTYQYQGVNLDIFYYSMVDDCKIKTHAFMTFDGYDCLESMEKKGGLRVIEQYCLYDGFAEINFLGEEFVIPNAPKKYLSFHYGEDFMTPKKWDYTNLERDNQNAKILEDKIGIVFLT